MLFCLGVPSSCTAAEDLVRASFDRSPSSTAITDTRNQSATGHRRCACYVRLTLQSTDRGQHHPEHIVARDATVVCQALKLQSLVLAGQWYHRSVDRVKNTRLEGLRYQPSALQIAIHFYVAWVISVKRPSRRELFAQCVSTDTAVAS
jgi:hypothetical protein